jgi:hypothetical protein
MYWQLALTDYVGIFSLFDVSSPWRRRDVLQNVSTICSDLIAPVETFHETSLLPLGKKRCIVLPRYRPCR